MTSTIDVAERLRAAKLRVTAPRLAVYKVVAHTPHISADTVALEVRSELGAVSTQTVYDTLKVLEGAGLIRSIRPANHPTRYEARVGDNHHHLICRSCGRVEDVDCAIGSAPCLEAAEDHGFDIDEAEVNYWGLCPDCKNKP